MENGTELTLNQADIDANKQYQCVFTDTAASHGTVNVDSDLEARHTPATTDASDALTLEAGILSVTGSNAAHYHLEGNELKVTAGAGGTIVSTAIFTRRATPRVITFEYNHNGLRTKKTVKEGGVTTTYEYTLHGKLITHMTKRVAENGEETVENLHFDYDAQSRPIFVKYNGQKYRYIHNMQADIVGIIDTVDNLVVEYKYDAWGRPVENVPLTGIGGINPFRYRSYVWDEEENDYYLASRYYDAWRNRFINADDDSYLGENGALVGYNLITYCKNNPVGYFDEEGTAFETVFDILSLAISAVEVISNPTDLTAWAGLMGDTVDLIPFVTGVGETIRTLRAADKIVDGADAVIDSYGHLRKINKGTGLEVHHILEKRFGGKYDYSKSGYQMPSVILEPDKHRTYTNLWRKEIAYGSTFDNEKILKAAAKIYNTEPELMGAAIYTMIKSTIEGR